MGRFSNILKKPISRRGALIGSAAGVAGGAAAIQILSGCSRKEPEGSPVEATNEDAQNMLEYEETEDDLLKLENSWELPLGSILLPSEGRWIAAIAKGPSAFPINIACAFDSTNGELKEVVTQMRGDTPSMALYDARCSDSVFAWAEIDMRTRSWSLYASAFSEGALTGNVSTLWQGDKDWSPPQFCCTGTKVFWQVMPLASGKYRNEHSGLFVWHVGDNSARQVIDSPGRFATPPTLSGETITCSPRVNPNQGIFYGISAYKTADDCDTLLDQLVLPQTVRPYTAVRMGNHFAFSVEAKYSTGGLLANMGSYISNADGSFLMLPREPFAGITGKDDCYIIKSRSYYFVLDSARERYSILTSANHSVDYGEYPARDGITSSLITYSTIKDASTGYPESVSVRSFSFA
ncbi:MAG: Tat pathway signal protein [Atopobiaceae bacterium]|nr:Tat pathway signal protein [Atopobiaceae bacterium]